MVDGHFVDQQLIAIRDADGNYKGILDVKQDVNDICALESERRFFRLVVNYKEINMSKIGLFYGSVTGNTGEVAQLIQQALNEIKQDMVEVFDVAETKIETMQNYDALILGISTWDIGELQYDWGDVVDDLDELDLSGKKIAIFGLGDQYNYADTFEDAIGILGEKMREYGAQLVGFTSIEGYEFDESRGVENDRFMGLALDEDNQSDLTTQRIDDWVKQLQKELKLL